TGGKRTNWLLIKHDDAFARAGDGDSILAEDRSVASGRSMDKIAERKGRGPKPFMLTTRKSARPDAVWQSNRADAADPVGRKKQTKRAPKGRTRAAAESRRPI